MQGSHAADGTVNGFFATPGQRDRCIAAVMRFLINTSTPFSRVEDPDFVESYKILGVKLPSASQHLHASWVCEPWICILCVAGNNKRNMHDSSSVMRFTQLFCLDLCHYVPLSVCTSNFQMSNFSLLKIGSLGQSVFGLDEQKNKWNFWAHVTSSCWPEQQQGLPMVYTQLYVDLLWIWCHIPPHYSTSFGYGPMC